MSILERLKNRRIDRIIQRIQELDGMVHTTIYSRWEADRQILELVKRLNQ